MNFLKTLKTMTVTTLLASPVMAGEFFVLEMDDLHQRGQSSIALKRELKQQFPDLKVQKADLLSVMAVVKSKNGRGQAELQVGQKYSAMEHIDGIRGDFHLEEETSFDRILITNPKANSKGTWKLHTQGQVKLSQIVVELEIEKAKEIVLDVDAHVRGAHTFKLKQLLQQQGDLAADYLIKGVTVIGKSKNGSGTVQLSVGQQKTIKEVLDGTPSQFHSDAFFSFSSVMLENPKQNSQGAWQLHTQGNVKIKEIILHLEEK